MWGIESVSDLVWKCSPPRPTTTAAIPLVVKILPSVPPPEAISLVCEIEARDLQPADLARAVLVVRRHEAEGHGVADGDLGARQREGSDALEFDGSLDQAHALGELPGPEGPDLLL